MKCAKCKKVFDYLKNNRSKCNECKDITKEKILKKKIEENLKKYPDGSDKDDYVECSLCGLRSGDLSLHVFYRHGLKIKEYVEQFGSTKSKNNIKRLTGENNHFFNHGGTLSPFSKNYKYYKSDEDITNLATKAAKSRKKNNNSDTSLEYYTSRGFSEEVSKSLLAERQTTFSLEKCINKYGLEEGTKIFEERQIKWQNTLNSKSVEEKSWVNSKKASFGFSSLWKEDSEQLKCDGYFYVISFDNNIKIGITSKDKIEKRYSGINKVSGLTYNLFMKVTNIRHAFQIEQILLNEFRSNVTRDKNLFFKKFGRYEILSDLDVNLIVEKAKLYIFDKTLAETTFKLLSNNE